MEKQLVIDAMADAAGLNCQPACQAVDNTPWAENKIVRRNH